MNRGEGTEKIYRFTEMKLAHPTGNEVPARLKSSLDNCPVMGGKWYAAFFFLSSLIPILFFCLFSVEHAKSSTGRKLELIYFTVSYKQRSGSGLRWSVFSEESLLN